MCIRSSEVNDNMTKYIKNGIEKKDVFHIRLQHFPSNISKKFYELIDLHETFDIYQ